MMKSYKDFEKEFIGDSDIATLIMVGYDSKEKGGLSLKKLNFGEDGNYRAYIVEGEAEIGSHYELVAEFTDWLRIYDDTSLAKEFHADVIKVFRAMEFGCIIQLLKEEKDKCNE